jgi:hypothetical protein
MPDGKHYLKTMINKNFATEEKGFSDTGVADYISTKYTPPHGGHTKNSLIRQEMQSYELEVRGSKPHLSL